MPADKPALKGRLLAAGELLGVLQQEPAGWLQGGAVAGSLDEAEIEALINERQAAKLGRDYARADAIREQLAEAGVILEDSREGTRWRRA